MNEMIILAGVLLHTDDLLTNGAQLGRMLSNPTKGIKHSLALNAFTGNIIGDNFRGETFNTFLVNLDSLIELLEILISTVPKAVELLAFFTGGGRLRLELLLYREQGWLEFC
jgi:hypothetical protein